MLREATILTPDGRANAAIVVDFKLGHEDAATPRCSCRWDTAPLRVLFGMLMVIRW